MKGRKRPWRPLSFYRAPGGSEVSTLPEQWPQHMLSAVGGPNGEVATISIPLRVVCESSGSWTGNSPKLVRNRSKIRIVYLHFADPLCEYAWAWPPSLRRHKEAALRTGYGMAESSQSRVQIMSVSRLRDYRGPALFSYGFRPFFFFGSVYAGAIILVWLPAFYGQLKLSTALAPRDWHVHEMLFGFIAAVVAGFLLTAVPNWTGRLPLQGKPLIVLFSSWVAGRIAVSISAWIGWAPAAAIDSVFLILLAASAAREIIAGKKWSNLMIVAIISLFAAGNLAFHLEAHFAGLAEYTTRGNIAVVISLVVLIGGRIIPSFTRNWLAKRAPGPMPAPFGRFDAATVGVSALVLLFWVVRPLDWITGGLLLMCGGLHFMRLVRWSGYRTFADRLVLILHIAYAFVPVGFILTALSAFDLVAPGAGIHAWTGGAIGTMTLAVMSRATLGHTGQQLEASPATQMIYAAVIIAALARICAVLETDHAGGLLVVAGIAWAVAFLGFAAAYSAALWSPRRL
jgi:uncharacterized protein involved in response to NO